MLVVGAGQAATTAALAREAPAPAVAPLAPEACSVGVFDVSPTVENGLVRFVLGGANLGGSSVDVEFVTTQTLYGLTIRNVALATRGADPRSGLSQPYAATLPATSKLKGVYLARYVDSAGTKHDCDLLNGLPPSALPYMTSCRMTRASRHEPG